jgi:hypothetical protein
LPETGFGGPPSGPDPESPGRTSSCRAPISERPPPGTRPLALHAPVSRSSWPPDCSASCANQVFGSLRILRDFSRWPPPGNSLQEPIGFRRGERGLWTRGRARRRTGSVRRSQPEARRSPPAGRRGRDGTARTQPEGGGMATAAWVSGRNSRRKGWPPAKGPALRDTTGLLPNVRRPLAPILYSTDAS